MNAHPSLQARAKELRLWGLVAHWDEYADQDWLEPLISREEQERQRRTLESRIRCTNVGRFKPMADFDWTWPDKIDREMVEDLFSFRFLDEATNVVVVGANGLGKTMILQNLAHQAALKGHSSLFVTASKLLNDIAEPDSASARERRIRKYCRPALLAIDELGYLSYDNRYADLLFEVVNRRHERKSTAVSTNRVFQEWNEIFPNATCVVTLVDRLTHHSEILRIEGDRSYRSKEAQERAALQKKRRLARRRAGRKTK
jgi:DNA replication protein DnaC